MAEAGETNGQVSDVEAKLLKVYTPEKIKQDVRDLKGRNEQEMQAKVEALTPEKAQKILTEVNMGKPSEK